MMNLMIVATDLEGGIGKDGTIPWRQTADMSMFSQLTNGCTVVMGRKTWESLPDKFRPLPNRQNIVVSRNHDYVAKGALVVDCIDLAIKAADSQVAFIGGAGIYTEVVNRKLVTLIHRTTVATRANCDTFLNHVAGYSVVSGSRIYPDSPSNNHPYIFELLVRNDLWN